MFDAHPLPQKLKRYGFEYVLITGEKDKAIYSQFFEGKKIGYEVFMLKNGNSFSSNSYPRHEDFGEKAWAFRNEQAAFDFYHNLMPNMRGQMALPF
ncbi:MAG: hypothetical protein ACPGJS_13410 [Flammeovirgaceae bacterium]